MLAYLDSPIPSVHRQDYRTFSRDCEVRLERVVETVGCRAVQSFQQSERRRDGSMASVTLAKMETGLRTVCAGFEISGQNSQRRRRRRRRSLTTKPRSTRFCWCCCCCFCTCAYAFYLKTGRTKRYVSNLDPFVRICRLTRCRYSTGWTGISLTANLLSGIKSLRIKSDSNGTTHSRGWFADAFL